MSGLRPFLLAAGLALGCAGRAPPLASAPLAGTLLAEAPAAASAATLPAPAPSAAPAADARRPRKQRGPSHRTFVAAHFATGVVSTLVVQPGTYLLAARIGETGHGLGPAIGALLLGAFMPPILNYTLQWAVGNEIAPRRDRFWPGFLVRQVAHLGIFVGAVVGGADFRNLGHAAAIVLTEAFVNSGLATMTAELTRRPRAAAPVAAELVVPVLEVKF